MVMKQLAQAAYNTSAQVKSRILHVQLNFKSQRRENEEDYSIPGLESKRIISVPRMNSYETIPQ